MGATLTVTVPEEKPKIYTWRPINWICDRKVPYIKITFEANTGEQRVWRLVPSDAVSVATIMLGLKYINEGKFKSVRNITLEQWLVEQWLANGGPAGAITITTD